jgi:hypothetical protein
MSAGRSAARYLSACQCSDPSFIASQRHALVTSFTIIPLLARYLAAGRRCSQYWTAWDAGWLFCTGTLFGGAWAGRPVLDRLGRRLVILYWHAFWWRLGRQARTGTTCCAGLEVNLDWDG